MMPDFGLNWTRLDWRPYDAQTGRFFVVDPLADAGQEAWSVYHFGFDNALRYNDPDGRCPGGCPGEKHGQQWRTSFGQGFVEQARSFGNYLVNAARHPVDNHMAAGRAMGQAIEQPVATARAAIKSIKSAYGNVTSSDPTVSGRAVGKATFTAAVAAATEGATRLVGGTPVAKTPSAAAEAAGFQGQGNYPGVDQWRNITLKPGTIVHAGEPGASGFATTSSGLARAQGSAESFSQGLQIAPHPVMGYRQATAAYEITSPTPAAMGTTAANPQFGAGGLPQLYIPNFMGVTQKISVTPFVR